MHSQHKLVLSVHTSSRQPAEEILKGTQQAQDFGFPARLQKRLLCSTGASCLLRDGPWSEHQHSYRHRNKSCLRFPLLVEARLHRQQQVLLNLPELHVEGLAGCLLLTLLLRTPKLFQRDTCVPWTSTDGQ